ncbi:MAG: hypothetical protein PHP22_03095 [Oscillospiraceae bacterium]|nr:hypothetical protein [Oscillospiraceae bacterium]
MILDFLLFSAFVTFLILFLVYREKAQNYIRRFDRLRRFSQKLHAEKRISTQEYEEATGERLGPDPGAIRVPPSGSYVPPQIGVQPQITVQSAPARVGAQPQIDVQPVPQQIFTPPTFIPVTAPPAQTFQPAQPVPPPRVERKAFNAMNALLIIGVLFIVLAGAVFTTTTWLYLPDIIRLLIVCSTSAVFFAASLLAEKALKIPKTGVAFYVIASIFLPLSVIGVGFFGLAGKSFSLSGAGRYWVFFAASAVLAVACWVGAWKYKFTAFAMACLWCVSASVVFLLSALHLKLEVYILLLYVYAAILIILGNLIRKRQGKALPVSLVLGHLPTFSMINAVAIAAIGSAVSGFGWLPGLSAILLAPLFLTDLFRGKNTYAGTIPFALLLTLGLTRLNTDGVYMHYLLLTVLAVVFISVIASLSVFPEKMRKWLMALTLILSAMIYLLQFAERMINDDWSVLQLIALAALLLSFLFLAYRNKERLILYFVPIITFTLIMLAASIVQHDIKPEITLSVLSSLFFFATYFADRKIAFSPRTIVSDIAFSLGCFLGAMVGVTALASKSGSVSALDLLFAMLPFAILFMILAVLIIEKKQGISSVLAGGAAPVAFILSCIPLIFYVEGQINGAWVMLVFFTALAVGSLYFYKNRRRSRAYNSLQASGLVTMIVTGVATCLWLVDDPEFIPAIAWIFTAYLGVRFILSLKDDFSKSTDSKHVVLSLATGASLYMSLVLSAYHWLGIDSAFFMLLLPATAALILAAIRPVIRLLGKKVHDALPHVERVGLYGLTLFSFLLSIAFFFEETMGLIALVYLFPTASILFRYLRKKAYLSVWFELLLIYGASALLVHRFLDGDPEWSGLVVFSLLFFLLAGLGRWLHGSIFETGDPATTKSLETQGNERKIDWLTLMSVLSPLNLLILGRYALWVGLILLGIYALCFYRRTHWKHSNSVALTVAGFFALLSFWVQPLFEIPGIILLEYNLIVAVAYFIFLYRFVWKNNETAMILFISACVSLAVLGVAAIFSGDLVDALILGVAALAMLIVSFMVKSKRWFILSAVTIVILGLYMTREFWESLDWWVYLLLVGCILIGLAAANEISKQKGERLSEKAKRLFKDWN